MRRSRVVDSIWFNQGQVCCAGSRILVAEAVADRFTELLARRMGTLIVGDPLKNRPISAPSSIPFSRAYPRAGRTGPGRGAISIRAAPCGCFYPPTFVTGVEPASILATEEIFGPVVTLTPFRTPEDAVALANNTRYGLAGSVWSENINLALDVAAKIRAGVVWINSANLFDAGAGFGGCRESGFGREGGREGWPPICTTRAACEKPETAPAAPVALPAEHMAAGPSTAQAKLYVGGKQARPDSGYSYAVPGTKAAVGLAGLGNRRISVTQSRPRIRLSAGAQTGITARRCFIIWPRTLPPARPGSPSGCAVSAKANLPPRPRWTAPSAASSGMPRRPTSSMAPCIRPSPRMSRWPCTNRLA